VTDGSSSMTRKSAQSRLRIFMDRSSGGLL
jgi:hypothetical protein